MPAAQVIFAVFKFSKYAQAMADATGPTTLVL